jgi:hypothetical protein
MALPSVNCHSILLAKDLGLQRNGFLVLVRR